MNATGVLVTRAALLGSRKDTLPFESACWSSVSEMIPLRSLSTLKTNTRKYSNYDAGQEQEQRRLRSRIPGAKRREPNVERETSHDSPLEDSPQEARVGHACRRHAPTRLAAERKKKYPTHPYLLRKWPSQN